MGRWRSPSVPRTATPTHPPGAALAPTAVAAAATATATATTAMTTAARTRLMQMRRTSVKLDDLYSAPPVIQGAVEREQELALERQQKSKASDILWLSVCFFGIMGSFVAYGLLLEYATSGGKKLHELSFLFVTSLLYTVTASVGRYARAEKPSTIPPRTVRCFGTHEHGEHLLQRAGAAVRHFPHTGSGQELQAGAGHAHGGSHGEEVPPEEVPQGGTDSGGGGVVHGGRVSRTRYGDAKHDRDGEQNANIFIHATASFADASILLLINVPRGFDVALS